MTGFGQASAPSRQTQGHWTIECSSVNRRQLEVLLQAPRALLTLEAHIRAEITPRFQRGRILISITGPASSPPPLISSTDAAAALANLRSIAQALEIQPLISLDTLLRHPLFQQPLEPSITTPSQNIWAELQPVLIAALDALAASRAREGANLRTELLRLLDDLETAKLAITSHAPQVPQRHRTLLLERLKTHSPVPAPDEQRLLTELALFAERCDITEELARLSSHIAHFRETCSAPGPHGRTLEFITQEISRELNTIAAKASDATIARLVITAKSLAEQIKEQLANVE